MIKNVLSRKVMKSGAALAVLLLVLVGFQGALSCPRPRATSPFKSPSTLRFQPS